MSRVALVTGGTGGIGHKVGDVDTDTMAAAPQHILASIMTGIFVGRLARAEGAGFATASTPPIDGGQPMD